MPLWDSGLYPNINGALSDLMGVTCKLIPLNISTSTFTLTLYPRCLTLSNTVPSSSRDPKQSLGLVYVPCPFLIASRYSVALRMTLQRVMLIPNT